MSLPYRQKLSIVALAVYWSTIFIVTHVPIPSLVYKAGVSDKWLHGVVYMVLVVLIWLAVSPYRKVNWRKTAVWGVLFAGLCYSVLDEVLQGYVGRNADIEDFWANFGGVVAGVMIVWFFGFHSAVLVVTGVCIFSLANLTKVNPADLVPTANAVFNLFAYGLFTILWVQVIKPSERIKGFSLRYLIISLALPAGFLCAVELFSAIAGNGFRIENVIYSGIGIAGAVVFVFFKALAAKS
ncbi:MAG TPA: VanZ family protein [Sedimentisphaerales bacterium]|nr:VanZ family protein [Sedimentisphaerales bacterium]